MSEEPDGQEHRHPETKTIGDELHQEINVFGRVLGNVVQIGKVVINNVPNLRRQLSVLGGIIITIIILATLTLVIVLKDVPPSHMAGDFRVAVAGFDMIGGNEESRFGTEIAEGLSLRLSQSLTEISEISVTVWGPDLVGTVEGRNQLERAENAASIAEKIGADVIIYGTVDITERVITVSPAFILSIQTSYEIDEILGQHQLGSPFQISGYGDLITRIEASDNLDRRINLLSNITIGLAYYSVHDYARAQDYFFSVEEEQYWDNLEGKQVLYLLLGNTAGHLDQLDDAEEYFEKSILVDPEYARAYVGLAGVYYLRAFGTEIDSKMIDISISNYQKAIIATNQPPLSDIQAKVHYGLGQCYLLQSLAGEEHEVNPAIPEFVAVINEYGEGDNPRIRSLAAESHARLGLIYYASNLPENAIEEYQTAISLLYDDQERAALFEGRIKSIQNDQLSEGDQK